MNTKAFKKIYEFLYTDETNFQSYNENQKSWIFKNGKTKPVRSEDELKELFKNPKNLENFWKNFKSFAQNDSGEDWLGTFDNFKKMMTERDVNCLLRSTQRILRSREEGEYIWEMQGDTGYFYSDGTFMYLYANAKNVKGTWECNGENSFVVYTNDNEFFSSKVGKWEKVNANTNTAPSNTASTTTTKVKYKQNDATLEEILQGKRLVKLYDKGDIVVKIQEKLGKIYTEKFKGVVDGKFGKKTKDAVIEFQRSNGLVDDGIVGDKTAKILFKDESTSTSGKVGKPTTQLDIKLPYTLSSSFTTKKSEPGALDKAHNLKGLEQNLDLILPSLYSKGMNPKINSIDFDIIDNKDSYTTKYTVEIVKSGDRRAWVGFTSRGSAGKDYIKRADGQITGSENADGKSLEQKLKSIGGDEMEIITIKSDSSIPYKQYFVQFTKPKQYPPYTVNESKIKKLIINKLNNKLQENKIQEEIVEKRLDYIISQLKETKNYKNINQYKRTKLFIDELKELESCGLL